MKKFLGIPYRRGGNSTRGMDCSGLTKKVFAEVFGVDLPHSSVAQSRIRGLEDIRPSEEELKTGDLLFFGPRRKRINHVGIYLANGDFLHSSRSSGVTISNLSEIYWKNRLISSKRMKDIDQAAGEQQALLAQATASRASIWLSDLLESRETSLEVGYRNTLLPFMNLNIDTFLWISSSESGYDAIWSRANPWNAAELGDARSFESRNGFRLSTELNAFGWLTITPSYTHVSDRSVAEADSPVRLLGIETLLAPPESRWHLAMSARAGNPDGMYGWRPSTVPSGANAMDISLGVRYHFSETLRMSFTGSRAYSELQDLQSADWRWMQTSNNFAFRLDLRF